MAEKILKATGGDLPVNILTWVIGGGIMIVCAAVFQSSRTHFEYVNGVVDYSEVALTRIIAIGLLFIREKAAPVPQ